MDKKEMMDVPGFPDHLLKEIPKQAYKRSETERMIDILRACVVPTFTLNAVRRANTNDAQFKLSMKKLVARGLVSVRIAPKTDRRRVTTDIAYTRKIYTTTPRGRIAIQYWVALAGLFEDE